ncbi:MAG: hypothetical protein HY366_01970 [Candidatus Aenigmarchaeota archaeon]|nr:hypothetical protein [Candidatus Aenigmarchaeota archaeon]
MNLRVVRSSVGKVYTKWQYFAVTGITMALVVAFYIFLTNVPLFAQAISSGYPLSTIINLMAALVKGIEQSAGFATAVTIFVSAVLVGVNASLLVYRVRNFGFSTKQGSSTLSGFVLGAFGAGCPACATGALSLAGVAGGLAALPFQGWELRLLSFALLVMPIYWLSRDIESGGACKI